MPPPLFALNNLKFQHILNVVHLEIPGNKIVCLVGKSGSGKTTLLKMLNRMLSPDSGTIHYCDQPIENMDAITLRRQVVMLPQNPVMFSGTIKDNLNAGLRFSLKKDADNQELEWILDNMQLNHNMDNSPASLSGGEKQRLAIGRIILMRPQVLLLDEPSSALDKDTQDTVMKFLIHQMRSNGSSIVLVTHSSYVARTYGDHVLDSEVLQ